MRTGVWETQLSMDAAMEHAGEWTALARRVIEEWTPGGRLTAEVLREWVGDPPGHGDACGAVIRGAARSGLIRHVGFTVATRPDAHGRVLREWERT